MFWDSISNTSVWKISAPAPYFCPDEAVLANKSPQRIETDRPTHSDVATVLQHNHTTPHNVTKLTSWSCASLERSPVLQLLKNFSTLHGTQGSRALHQSLVF
jgi:hypothetical protein